MGFFIQIQHLLKLNTNTACREANKLYSNTTLVKVKYHLGGSSMNNFRFKYNTC